MLYAVSISTPSQCPCTVRPPPDAQTYAAAPSMAAAWRVARRAGTNCQARATARAVCPPRCRRRVSGKPRPLTRQTVRSLRLQIEPTRAGVLLATMFLTEHRRRVARGAALKARLEKLPKNRICKLFVRICSRQSAQGALVPILARSLALDAHTTGQPIRHELPIRCLPVIRRLPDPPRSRRLRAPHRPRRRQ